VGAARGDGAGAAAVSGGGSEGPGVTWLGNALALPQGFALELSAHHPVMTPSWWVATPDPFGESVPISPSCWRPSRSGLRAGRAHQPLSHPGQVPLGEHAGRLPVRLTAPAAPRAAPRPGRLRASRASPQPARPPRSPRCPRPHEPLDARGLRPQTPAGQRRRQRGRPPHAVADADGARAPLLPHCRRLGLAQKKVKDVTTADVGAGTAEMVEQVGLLAARLFEGVGQD
jgi:hypothetical protein